MINDNKSANIAYPGDRDFLHSGDIFIKIVTFLVSDYIEKYF